jgi:hypothetical protein
MALTGVQSDSARTCPAMLLIAAPPCLNSKQTFASGGACQNAFESKAVGACAGVVSPALYEGAGKEGPSPRPVPQSQYAAEPGGDRAPTG